MFSYFMLIWIGKNRHNEKKIMRFCLMPLLIFESEISFQLAVHGNMFLGLFVLFFLAPSFVDQQHLHIIVMLHLGWGLSHYWLCGCATSLLWDIPAVWRAEKSREFQDKSDRIKEATCSIIPRFLWCQKCWPKY